MLVGAFISLTNRSIGMVGLLLTNSMAAMITARRAKASDMQFRMKHQASCSRPRSASNVDWTFSLNRTTPVRLNIPEKKKRSLNHIYRVLTGFRKMKFQTF